MVKLKVRETCQHGYEFTAWENDPNLSLTEFAFTHIGRLALSTSSSSEALWGEGGPRLWVEGDLSIHELRLVQEQRYGW